MKLIIDIPEEDYKRVSAMVDMIRNGTPLSEELEKIRAEIENHCGLAKEEHCKYCSYCNNLMGVIEILEIIDKYKAEREELKGESE